MSKLRLSLRLSATVIFPALLAACFVQHASAATVARSSGAPLAFEPNKGQSDAEVRYLVRRGSSAMLFTETESLLAVTSGTAADQTRRTEVLRFVWAGSAPKGISGELRTGGISNYLIGNDRSKWMTGIPQFSRVRYRSLYPGVDLVYYGKDGTLEYDLVVAPGADTSALRLRIAGAAGMELRDGDLVMHTRYGGDIVQGRPVVYQEIAGVRKAVGANFQLSKSGEVTFELGAYDRSRELIIDPTISYARYFGAANVEFANGVAVDSTGAIYVTGSTTSTTGLSTVGSFQSTYGTGAQDAYVMKLNPAGTAVVFSTYLGGSGSEDGKAIAVDTNGSAYVVGTTASSNFPTSATGNLRTTLQGSSDAFLTKLTASGSSVGYSTFIGNAGTETAWGLALDAANSAYVVGTTTSLLFHDNVVSGGQIQGASDAFIAKVSATPAIVGTRYIGGATAETAYAVAVKNSNVYVTGQSNSSLTGTTGTIQPTKSTGIDAFIVKLPDTLASQTWWTFFGGAGTDSGRAIALDDLGTVYVAGRTSLGVTATGGLQAGFGGGANDGFVLAMNTDATVKYSATHLGGVGDDYITGLTVDPNNSVIVSGSTSSDDLPVLNNLKNPALDTSTDAFVAKYHVRLSSYLFSTYIGGSGTDNALAIASDNSGVYIVGDTLSTDFQSVTGTLQNQDAFLAKLTSNCTYTLSPNPVAFGSAGGGPTTVTVTTGAECGWTAVTSDNWITLSSNPWGAGNGSFTVTASANPAGPERSGVISIGGVSLPVNQASGCTYLLSSASTSVGSGASTGSFNVTTSAPGCAWTAMSNKGWATITSGGSGTGNGTINYSVGINPLPTSRQAIVTVGAQSYSITQAATVRNGHAISMYGNGGWHQDATRAFAESTAALTFAWGTPGYTPLAGDWTGNGVQKVGVFQNGTWILDMNNSRVLDAGDIIFAWGNTGMTPVVGDWNGDGITDVGVFQSGNWYVDLNGNRQLDGGEAFAWGPSNGIPFVGDWSGNGKSKVGSYNPTTGAWILDTTGDRVYQFPADFHFKWGSTGFTPLVGDFFGTGTDTVGAYLNGAFWLENGDGFSNAGDQFFTFVAGSPGSPVVGDWNNSGSTKVGILNGNQFTLDYDGDRVLNLANDKQFTFGTTGQQPVIGRWNP